MRVAWAFLWVAVLAAAMPVQATEDASLLVVPLTRARGQSLEALRVTYAPGEASRPHVHGRDAYVYVLSGHIRSQLEGRPVRTYAAGQSWFEPAGMRHLVSANASDRAPACMLVVFVGASRAQPGVRTQSR